MLDQPVCQWYKKSFHSDMTLRDKTGNFISAAGLPTQIVVMGRITGSVECARAKWSDNEEKRRSTDGSVGRRCTLGRGGGDTPSTWGAVMQDLEVSGPAQQTHTQPFSDLLASPPSIPPYYDKLKRRF